MLLSEFISKNEEKIIDTWMSFAQEHIRAAQTLNETEVRDHIHEMLRHIVEDLQTPQSKQEQDLKSKGLKPDKLGDKKQGRQHGLQRSMAGYNILELGAEFRALRASVIRLWQQDMKEKPGPEELKSLIRFNEAMDELWIDSMQRFDQHLEESKAWFLGVLGHDLRSPLVYVSGVADLLSGSKNLVDDEKELLSRVKSNVKRSNQLINDLLELTRMRLGNGLKLRLAKEDLVRLTEAIVQEMGLIYPKSKIHFESDKTATGEWDGRRLTQLITNLLNNALRHGRPDRPVHVSVSDEDNVVLVVHNEGPPIPQDLQEKIFEGHLMEHPDFRHRDSMGLGLYIAHQIVAAHEGKISFKSCEKEGTTFQVNLPRSASAS